MTTPVYREALDVMSRTVYGEARGEGWLGKIAVCHVILNRVKLDGWMGHSIEDVCLKASQFSCWNDDDPNRAKCEAASLDDHAQLRECLAACAAACFDLVSDPTSGCTHYMTVMRREEGWPHHWGEPREPDIRIGTHFFYRGIA